MSFVSRLIDPNPPLTSAQVQQAVAAAIDAADAPSTIESIQRGRVSLQPGNTFVETHDVTITSVDMSKATCNLLTSAGYDTAEGSSGARYMFISLWLQDTTTLRIQREFVRALWPGEPDFTLSYEVVEKV